MKDFSRGFTPELCADASNYHSVNKITKYTLELFRNNVIYLSVPSLEHNHAIQSGSC